MIARLDVPLKDVLRYKNNYLRLCLPFDAILRVYDLWRNDLFSNAEKIDLSLQILVVDYKRIRWRSAEEKSDILSAIFAQHVSLKNQPGSSDAKIFDFVQDAGYIYASFMMDYSIDLLEVQGRLHWAKFISLFQGLSERTKIREVMGIRARKIPKPTKYNDEEIRALLELKAHYALEMSQEEQEAQFNRALDRFGALLEKRAIS